MRRITHYGRKDPLLHIETPLGIVNIRVGLTNMDGNKVESIEVIPDRPEEGTIHLDGLHNTRLIHIKQEAKP